MFKSSETTSVVYSAFLSAQKSIGTIPKNGVNAGTKSRYAKLEDILTVVRPILNDFGLCLMQCMSEDCSLVITRIVHAQSCEFIECSIAVRVEENPRNQMQAIGSCLTYGSRYGLSFLLGLAAVEDDDGEAAGHKKEQAKPKVSSDFRSLVERMSVEESRELYARLKEDGTEEARAKMAIIYELKSQSK